VRINLKYDNNNNNNNNKPEPILESAYMILYWATSIKTDKMVDFNTPDIVFINRQHITALA
jgi:hypothetical protein